jgi:hypothetical protein
MRDNVRPLSGCGGPGATPDREWSIPPQKIRAKDKGTSREKSRKGDIPRKRDIPT